MKDYLFGFLSCPFQQNSKSFALMGVLGICISLIESTSTGNVYIYDHAATLMHSKYVEKINPPKLLTNYIPGSWSMSISEGRFLFEI